MSLYLKLFKFGFIGFLVMSVAVVAIIGAAYLIYSPQLPTVESLKDVQLQTPLKVYSREGKLIALYGKQRRVPLQYDELPSKLIYAFLAAEDDRFFEHPGVDYQGLLRAGINLVLTGQKAQGGSTITMQVARNFFLTPERTYTRKIKEILLALQIEETLSKQEILALYLNKIYLGQRAYGVGAASEVYYGKNVAELTLPQVAMIAGLPKAPSRFNPVSNVERATVRRDYVLGRMFKLEMITADEYEEALLTPVEAKKYAVKIEVDAPYVGEMVRAQMTDLYGEEAYTAGYSVYTTIEAAKQLVAVDAIQNGIIAYDLRHGYRGPEGSIPEDQLEDATIVSELVSEMQKVANLIPGIVIEANDEFAQVALEDEIIQLDLESVKWASKYVTHNSRGPRPKLVSEVLSVGDVIRVSQVEGGWQLRQVPDVSAALVSLNPEDGGIAALVGGFDYYSSKFNRVIQANRQPGSSFKPIIYSAALEAGFTPATTINDAPVVFEDKHQEDAWRPHNYSGKFFGPTRILVVLYKSRNMVSIRLLNDMGRRHAMQHVTKFGFERERLPYDLTLALGSGVVTPLELARGYSVFANGGYHIEPYLIERIESEKGEILFQSGTLSFCEAGCQAIEKVQREKFDQVQEINITDDKLKKISIDKNTIDTNNSNADVSRTATRVIDEQNAYQMVSMLKDVIRRGTATKAKALGRNDIAGKTGTTNDQHDAWFSGFNGDVVATAWVGFDQDKPLGKREVGGTAALPIWIDYMRVALEGTTENSLPMPQGIITMRIDQETGLLVNQDSNQGIEETFREEFAPTKSVDVDTQFTFQQEGGEPGKVIEIPEQLF